MKLFKWFFLTFLLLCGMMGSVDTKAVSVRTYEALKKKLESSGTETIQLSKDILISGKIVVQGTKTIDGQGFSLRRKATSGAEYYGVLLDIGKSGVKGKLTCSHLVISGNCDSTKLTNGVKGRLIRVVENGSALILTDKCILKNNYASNDAGDAGGGVTIKKGCSMIMQGESEIRNNSTKIGGAGVRVEEGGKFEFIDGKIESNSSYSLPGQPGFDGRGGGIHNVGTVIIHRGEVVKNQACGNSSFGGIGGGIYNQGLLQIINGKINENRSLSGGAGIYSSGKGSYLEMDGGTVMNNQCENAGGGVYANNGCQFRFLDGEIARNTAGTGGGIYVSKDLEMTKMTMSGGYVYGNCGTNATYSVGGGIRNNNSQLVISGGRIGINRSGEKEDNTCPNSTVANYSTEIHNSGNCIISGGMICSSVADARLIVNAGILNIDPESESLIAGTGYAGILNNAYLYMGEKKTGKPSVDGDFIYGIINNDIFKMWRGSVSGSENGIKNAKEFYMYGGKASGKYGVALIQGRTVFSGDLNVKRVYLNENQVLHAENNLNMEQNCELSPKDYFHWRSLVQFDMSNGGTNHFRQFSLTSKNPFGMKADDKTIFMEEIHYQIHFDRNGGHGTIKDLEVPIGTLVTIPEYTLQRAGYKLAGWSTEKTSNAKNEDAEFPPVGTLQPLANEEVRIVLYAVWVSVPTIESKYSDNTFYEGEFFTSDFACSLVNAHDIEDGDLSSEIFLYKVQYPTGEYEYRPKLKSFVNIIGTMRLFFRVINSKMEMKEYIHVIRILPNSAPKMEGKKRYFFLDEVENMGEEQLQKELRNTITMIDDYDLQEDLMNECSCNINSKACSQPGCYRTYVQTTDQYGHRFYMKPGEKKRYGVGKTGRGDFLLTIVAHMSQPQEKEKRYVRFISKEFMDSLGQSSKWNQGMLNQMLNEQISQESSDLASDSIWVFDKSQVEAIRLLDEEMDDLFSEDTNREFLTKFSTCKIQGKEEAQ